MQEPLTPLREAEPVWMLGLLPKPEDCRSMIALLGIAVLEAGLVKPKRRRAVERMRQLRAKATMIYVIVKDDFMYACGLAVVNLCSRQAGYGSKVVWGVAD